jgi:zinc/manganese transport system substrate-binding protein
MKKLFFIFSILFSAILFSSILTSTFALAKTLNVVTSIQALGALAQEVGGDKVSVTSLSKGYMDPHFVEAKPNLILALHKADLLIHVGLDLEVGWLPPLLLGSRNTSIKLGTDGNLCAGDFIHILKVPSVKVDRSMGDIHPQGNPHFWIPPKNGLLIAKGISDRLKKLQPDDAKYFDMQYEKFAKKIADLEKTLEPKVKRLNHVKVVLYHDSWVYVSTWLGLDEVGYVEIKPGVPPDPSHLVDLIKEIKKVKAKVILMESFYNKDIAKSVAEKSGAKLLELPSDVGASEDIKTYSDLALAIVNKISGAL